MKTTIYNIAFFLIIISFVSCAASSSNFKLGKQYYDEGNFDQAIIELEKSSKHDSSINDRISAYEYLGDAYTRKGNLDKAVLSYRNAYDLMQVQITEIIDEQKELNLAQHGESYYRSRNTQEKIKKLHEKLSKIRVRAEELQIKIKNLK
jgi:tetratricopeptide (TPR) repeat protein